MIFKKRFEEDSNNQKQENWKENRISYSFLTFSLGCDLNGASGQMAFLP